MPRTSTTAAAQQAQAQASCVHHWMIDAPNGRESSGRCKRCGLEKAFQNSTERVMWEQTNTIRNDFRGSARSTRDANIRLADEN